MNEKDNQEEILEEETTDNGESQEESQEDNQTDEKEEETKKEETSKPTNEKEQNRKGYEKRQSKKVETGVSREEFETLRGDIDTVKGENDKLKFQRTHPEITDDLYKSLDAQSKGLGVEKEELLKSDPVWKNYLETNTAKSRVDGGTPSPSGRVKAGGNNSNAWEQSSDEFNQKLNQVLGG